MTVVVRLSRLADIRKVTPAIIHNILLAERVRSSCDTKSKQPLLLSISTMVIVASRNSTTPHACPTYFRKTFSAMNCFTSALLGNAPFRNSAYSLAYCPMTKSVP